MLKPEPRGSNRITESDRRRRLAADVAARRPTPEPDPTDPNAPNGGFTRTNDDESLPRRPASFTKGLRHNDDGLVKDDADYVAFRTAVNSEQPTGGGSFANVPTPKNDQGAARNGFRRTARAGGPFTYRGFESPRSGHAYDLQGPDAEALCMPPAPAFGSDELSYEMLEVYVAALLRDTPFEHIADPTQAANREAGALLAHLEQDPWIGAQAATSFSDRRRLGRPRGANGAVTPAVAFRGSSPGCGVGPYVSQFLLVGNASLESQCTRRPEDGYVRFGAVEIDQRVTPQSPNVDYMTSWSAWLDVQDGADTAALQRFEANKRFISTPRDLATYVHYDQLYQAYLTAALILLEVGAPFDPGFPSGGRGDVRASFATFGGPHLLSLVTEVSSRALRAVRRQKFNYHNRARPEAIGGRLTLAENNLLAPLGDRRSQDAAEDMLDRLPDALRDAIKAHNLQQNAAQNALDPETNGRFDGNSLLLPMAFPEGSPMHPAYGAGHATVAGACVTVLKAFFQMFTTSNGWTPTRWSKLNLGTWIAPTPTQCQKTLTPINDGSLTLQGELNKLAANISIGRNFAGVHYYSDYYDSVRLGERIAIAILQEQMTNYPEPAEMRLNGFDGERITIGNVDGAGRAVSDYDLTLAFGGATGDPAVHSPNADPNRAGQPFSKTEADNWWRCVPADGADGEMMRVSAREAQMIRASRGES